MNIKSRLKTSSVALLMVAVVSLLIIPLPTAVLDFMFILNLTISLVILFITMYIKETLEYLFRMNTSEINPEVEKLVAELSRRDQIHISDSISMSDIEKKVEEILQ